jgi:hypothetical protein
LKACIIKLIMFLIIFAGITVFGCGGGSDSADNPDGNGTPDIVPKYFSYDPLKPEVGCWRHNISESPGGDCVDFEVFDLQDDGSFIYRESYYCVGQSVITIDQWEGSYQAAPESVSLVPGESGMEPITLDFIDEHHLQMADGDLETEFTRSDPQALLIHTNPEIIELYTHQSAEIFVTVDLTTGGSRDVTDDVSFSLSGSGQMEDSLFTATQEGQQILTANYWGLCADIPVTVYFQDTYPPGEWLGESVSFDVTDDGLHIENFFITYLIELGGNCDSTSKRNTTIYEVMDIQNGHFAYATSMFTMHGEFLSDELVEIDWSFSAWHEQCNVHVYESGTFTAYPVGDE